MPTTEAEKEQETFVDTLFYLLQNKNLEELARHISSKPEAFDQAVEDMRSGQIKNILKMAIMESQDSEIVKPVLNLLTLPQKKVLILSPIAQYGNISIVSAVAKHSTTSIMVDLLDALPEDDVQSLLNDTDPKKNLISLSQKNRDALLFPVLLKRKNYLQEEFVTVLSDFVRENQSDKIRAIIDAQRQMFDQAVEDMRANKVENILYTAAMRGGDPNTVKTVLDLLTPEHKKPLILAPLQDPFYKGENIVSVAAQFSSQTIVDHFLDALPEDDAQRLITGPSNNLIKIALTGERLELLRTVLIRTTSEQIASMDNMPELFFGLFIKGVINRLITSFTDLLSLEQQIQLFIDGLRVSRATSAKNILACKCFFECGVNLYGQKPEAIIETFIQIQFRGLSRDLIHYLRKYRIASFLQLNDTQLKNAVSIYSRDEQEKLLVEELMAIEGLDKQEHLSFMGRFLPNLQYNERDSLESAIRTRYDGVTDLSLAQKAAVKSLLDKLVDFFQTPPKFKTEPYIISQTEKDFLIRHKDVLLEALLEKIDTNRVALEASIQGGHVLYNILNTQRGFFFKSAETASIQTIKEIIRKLRTAAEEKRSTQPAPALSENIKNKIEERSNSLYEL